MKFAKSKTTEIPPLKTVGDKKKLKKSLLIFKLSFLFLLLAFSTYGVYSFNHTYAIQSPIVVRSPLVPRLHEVIVSPVASGSAKTSYIFNVGAIADKIYTLESSGGKNDGCRNLGLFNGYGYRQNSFEWICYPSHEIAREHVIAWLEQNIKSGNIENALCRYNKGIDETGCTYSMNYLSLQ